MGLLDDSDVVLVKTFEAKDSEKKKITVSNRNYAFWLAKDQIVMSYLTKVMNQDILPQIIGLEHASEVWGYHG
jgi:hypothetical protein